MDSTPEYGSPEWEVYEQDERERLEAEHGTVYNTSEATAKYAIEGFMAPFCTGKDRETGDKVVLAFQHSPRFYWEVSRR